MHRNLIQKLLYLLIFLLPFSNINLGPTLTYRYIILIIFGLQVALNHGKIYFEKGQKLLVPYIVLFIFLVLVHFNINYFIFMLTDMLLPIYVGYSLFKVKRSGDKLINCLILSGMVTAFMGLFETCTGINIMDKLYGLETIRWAANDYRLGIPRAYANFGISIAFCSYLCMLQYLCLYMIFSVKKNIYWWPYLLFLLESILTLSRGPIFINLLVQVIFFYKQKVFVKKKYFVMILCLVGAGCVFALYSDVMTVIIASVGVFIDSGKYKALANDMGFGGAEQRLQLFTWIFERTQNKLLTGNGFGTEFSVVVNEYGHKKTSIENYYLSIFFTYGLTGLFATLFLFFQLIKKFKPPKLLAADLKVNSDFASYVFFICLFYFFTIFTVSISMEGIFLYVLIGMGLASAAEKNSSFTITGKVRGVENGK